MYVVGSVAVLYFNVFVLIAQLFRRFPALIVLAPKQMEPPFLVTQFIVMGLFIWLGIAAVPGFRLAPTTMRAGILARGDGVRRAEREEAEREPRTGLIAGAKDRW